MPHLFAPPPIVALPITGRTETFPVRRVYCIGRNYADHAVEMGHDPEREPPFFFQKNPDSLVIDGIFPYPAGSSDVHHEIELVVCLHSGGHAIPAGDALRHVYGYAVGLDMTRRDLQQEAKRLSRPWEVAKAFEKAAPISAVAPAEAIGHPETGAISLSVNGELRQEGDINQMIWKVPEAIAYLSTLFHLAAGDVIMTGTPAGVGPVQRGDRLEGHIEHVGGLTVTVA